MSLDFKGMEDEIRRQPVESYAPKRAARAIEISEPSPTSPLSALAPIDEDALTEDIKQNAYRVTTMIGNLRERERLLSQEVSELKARLEQHVSRIAQLESELESTKLELKTEHTERVRLRSVFESVGGLVADALHFKHG